MQSGNRPLLIVLGTRPEAIKLWPLILKADEMSIPVKIVSTNQQKDLLGQTLMDLKIAPRIDFQIAPVQEISSPEAFVFETTAKLINIIKRERPGLVIVQGDTGSALAGAMAAFFSKIPVGHVEAGLRSNDLLAPWPEEGNRRIIDAISKYLWVPTNSDAKLSTAKDQEVIVVGNTVVDALKIILREKKRENSIGPRKILVTLHRRESFGDPLISSLKKLIDLSEIVEHKIVFFQHPNPNVESAIAASNLRQSRIKIESPLPYTQFIRSLQDAELLITDSGGLQEEATTLNIPLLVVRDTTERQSSVSENALARLVGSSGESLIESALEFLNKAKNASEVTSFSQIYGDGDSSERIIRSAIKELER